MSSPGCELAGIGPASEPTRARSARLKSPSRSRRTGNRRGRIAAEMGAVMVVPRDRGADRGQCREVAVDEFVITGVPPDRDLDEGVLESPDAGQVRRTYSDAPVWGVGIGPGEQRLGADVPGRARHIYLARSFGQTE